MKNIFSYMTVKMCFHAITVTTICSIPLIFPKAVDSS